MTMKYRTISTPDPTKSTSRPARIQDGGLESTSLSEIKDKLNVVTALDMGVANGVVRLNERGKVPMDNIDINDIIYPILDGPSVVQLSNVYVYTIVNHDVMMNYDVSVDNGTVVKVNDKIYLSTPDGSFYGSVIKLTVNKYTLDIRVEDVSIKQPLFNNLVNGQTVGGGYEVRTQAFQTIRGSASHSSSTWEIAKDPEFTDIVSRVVESTIYKTNLYLAGKVDISQEYYIRVRFHGSTGVISAWSEVVKFNTLDSYVKQPEITVPSYDYELMPSTYLHFKCTPIYIYNGKKTFNGINDCLEHPERYIEGNNFDHYTKWTPPPQGWYGDSAEFRISSLNNYYYTGFYSAYPYCYVYDEHNNKKSIYYGGEAGTSYKSQNNHYVIAYDKNDYYWGLYQDTGKPYYYNHQFMLDSNKNATYDSYSLFNYTGFGNGQSPYYSYTENLINGSYVYINVYLHDTTDWEVATDEQFINIIYSTYDSPYTLYLNIKNDDRFKPGSTYYVRCRHNNITTYSNVSGTSVPALGKSAWSLPVKFKTVVKTKLDSPRTFYRHESNKGTVMVWRDQKDVEHHTLVLDAAYRGYGLNKYSDSIDYSQVVIANTGYFKNFKPGQYYIGSYSNISPNDEGVYDQWVQSFNDGRLQYTNNAITNYKGKKFYLDTGTDVRSSDEDALFSTKVIDNYSYGYVGSVMYDTTNVRLRKFDDTRVNSMANYWEDEFSSRLNTDYLIISAAGNAYFNNYYHGNHTYTKLRGSASEWYSSINGKYNPVSCTPAILARRINIDGVGCDLPNIQTTIRIYLSMTELDTLDPTANNNLYAFTVDNNQYPNKGNLYISYESINPDLRTQYGYYGSTGYYGGNIISSTKDNLYPFYTYYYGFYSHFITSLGYVNSFSGSSCHVNGMVVPVLELDPYSTEPILTDNDNEYRSFTRHASGKGTVMTWVDSEGTQYKTFIADAAYRKILPMDTSYVESDDGTKAYVKYAAYYNNYAPAAKAADTLYSGDINEFKIDTSFKDTGLPTAYISTYFNNYSSYNNTGEALSLIINDPPSHNDKIGLSDWMLNRSGASMEDPETSQQRTDKIIAKNHLYSDEDLPNAASYCRSLEIDGIENGLDLPNLQTLKRIYSSMYILDEMDPTASTSTMAFTVDKKYPQDPYSTNYCYKYNWWFKDPDENIEPYNGGYIGCSGAWTSSTYLRSSNSYINMQFMYLNGYGNLRDLYDDYLGTCGGDKSTFMNYKYQDSGSRFSAAKAVIPVKDLMIKPKTTA